MSGSTLRTFRIDGEERTDRTYRTSLIEHYTEIPGRTFLDIGAADGYESRAVALAGASRTVAVELKEELFEQARISQAQLEIANLDVLRLDARRIDEHGLGTFDVVLCFGFLYHLRNPFNMLKRLRAMTGDLLLLETHVAPVRLDGLRRLHAQRLHFGLVQVELDGLRVEGMAVVPEADPSATKGTVDEAWTLWLTEGSLIRALVRAGFAVVDYHHELDPTCPDVVRRCGERLGFGRANTKVWIAARPWGPASEPGRPEERVVDGVPGAASTVVERLRRRRLLAQTSA